MEWNLHTSCRFIRGVGPARAKSLERAGIMTVEDLLFYLPLRYEDRSRFTEITALKPGEPKTIEARIGKAKLVRTRKRGFTILQVSLTDRSGEIRAIWYNQPFLRNILLEGREAAFFGAARVARRGRSELVLENPKFEILSPDDPEKIHTGRVVPIYQRIGPLSPRQIRRILHSVFLAFPSRIFDPLPEEVRLRYGLLDRVTAFRNVHFPPGPPQEPYNRGTSPAHRRLVFEEMFLLQSGLAMQKRVRRQTVRGRDYSTTPELRRKLRSILPFRLTLAQRRVLKEIVGDLRKPSPMNRLLQGEVGSGKTIVALLAMLIVIENRYQAALMVPTGILAEQHYLTIRKYLRGKGYRVELLTSSVKGVKRKLILEGIASGMVQMTIGTHSLVQEKVRFRRLGIIVIDEQHKFGVRQRGRFQEGGAFPDTLVMTATPIPRTLTLTVFGDLDLSIIDQLPPGRRPVRTFLREEKDRPSILEYVRREAKRGRQAYIVSPRLEETGRSRLRAARTLMQQLADGPFAGLSIALLHGRMKPEEKEKTMAEFASGRTSILVATTVVEVGIDVPGATIMMIENAERFGLSQLHQLRGRIGRGKVGGVCILLTGEEANPEARIRLQKLVDSHDGFVISEADLEFRGPGELLGMRQSGVPDLWWARILGNRDLLEKAREAAFLVFSGNQTDKEGSEGWERYVEERWQRKFGRIQVG